MAAQVQTWRTSNVAETAEVRPEIAAYGIRLPPRRDSTPQPGKEGEDASAVDDEDDEDESARDDWHDARADDEYGNIDYLTEVFAEVDSDKDGRLNKRKLIKALRRCTMVAEFFGLPKVIRQEDGSRETLERVFQAVDCNNDREITWGEFRAFFRTARRKSIRMHKKSPRQEEELQQGGTEQDEQQTEDGAAAVNLASMTLASMVSKDALSASQQAELKQGQLVPLTGFRETEMFCQLAEEFNEAGRDEEPRMNKRELVLACRRHMAVADYFGIKEGIYRSSLEEVLQDDADRDVSPNEFMAHYRAARRLTQTSAGPEPNQLKVAPGGAESAAGPSQAQNTDTEILLQVKLVSGRIILDYIRFARGCLVSELKSYINREVGERLPFRLLHAEAELLDNSTLTCLPVNAILHLVRMPLSASIGSGPVPEAVSPPKHDQTTSIETPQSTLVDQSAFSPHQPSSASIADHLSPTPKSQDAHGPPSSLPLTVWSVDHVCRWLARMPFLPQEVGEVLRQHAVNGMVLSTLSEQDLETMGVRKFGWRRQITLGLKGLKLEATISQTTIPVQTRTPVSSGCIPPLMEPITSSTVWSTRAASPVYQRHYQKNKPGLI